MNDEARSKKHPGSSYLAVSRPLRIRSDLSVGRVGQVGAVTKQRCYAAK